MSTPEVVLVKFGGRTLALGAVIGSAGAPANTVMKTIATALQGALAHAEDVQRSDAGPMQKAERVQQALAPAVKSLQENSKAILGVREQLTKRMSTPVIAPWSSATPYYQANIDTLLGQRFAVMDPKQRATALAALREDPQENMEMLEALARCPRALTGLSKAEHQGLQTTALRTMRPDDMAMMETETEQLAVAEKAVVIASQIVADAGLPRAVLAEHAPAVGEIAKLQPLRFADEHPTPPRHAVQMAGAVE